MKTKHFAKGKSTHQSGQAMILMLLIFSLVMLGAIAFAIDMGMLWYHRQAAQNAAEAACTCQINMHGTPGITMDLNGTTSDSIIKATLLR